MSERAIIGDVGHPDQANCKETHASCRVFSIDPASEIVKIMTTPRDKSPHSHTSKKEL